MVHFLPCRPLWDGAELLLEHPLQQAEFGVDLLRTHRGDDDLPAQLAGKSVALRARLLIFDHMAEMNLIQAQLAEERAERLHLLRVPLVGVLADVAYPAIVDRRGSRMEKSRCSLGEEHGGGERTDKQRAGLKTRQAMYMARRVLHGGTGKGWVVIWHLISRGGEV